MSLDQGPNRSEQADNGHSTEAYQGTLSGQSGGGIARLGSARGCSGVSGTSRPTGATAGNWAA